MGQSLLRQVQERETIFRGMLQENGWQVYFEDGMLFDSHKGIGLIRLGADGLPSALIWGHVDDFLIHAITKSKCDEALDVFMTAALRIGLICQPCKTSPSSQIQKHCGFLYNTKGIPCLEAPQSKVDRSLASIQFLRSGAPTQQLSCLTLAVVIGLLQSIVEATAHNVGQTFLSDLCD